MPVTAEVVATPKTPTPTVRAASQRPTTGAALLPTPWAALAFGLGVLVLLLAPVVPAIYLVVVPLDGLILALVLVDFWLAPGAKLVRIQRDVDPRLSLGAENLVKLRARNLGGRRARL